MSQPPTTSKNIPPTSRGRGRGRGTSRGGLGKYLRASGRGRGRGRPAEFNQRLLLNGEAKPDLTEEEAAEASKELREKYGRRRLGTNADRYKEEEVELDSDGMVKYEMTCACKPYTSLIRRTNRRTRGGFSCLP